MKDPVISVVIPLYNKGNLFRNTLASALRQTFDDYEIIVIDDGSTDDSSNIVKEFKDQKIQYYYQGNSGLPAVARNNGIKYAKGRFIAFLDADDIWYPQKLDKCYEVFIQHPDIDLVSHDEIARGVSGRIIRRLSYGPYVRSMFRKLLFKGNCLSPSATVVKKEALVKVGMFEESLNFFSVEDYDLWLKLSHRHKFYFIPEILGEYLLHEKNISADTERHYNNQIEVIRKNFKGYENKSLLNYFLINFRISKIYFIIARDFARKRRMSEMLEYFFKMITQFFKHE